MARLSDVPIVLRSLGPWTFAKRVYQQIVEDNVLTWAAALAYSWLFAIFPFAIFLLTLLPLLPDRFREEADDFITGMVYQTLAGESARIVANEIDRLLAEPRGGLLSLGLIFAIWAASGGMSATLSALDQTYDITKCRPFWLQRLVAIGLTFVVATLVLLVIVLIPIGTAVINRLEAWGILFGWSRVLLEITRYSVALALLFTVLAAIYHFGASVRRRFRFFSPGAVFCVVVWILVGLGFRIYLNSFGGSASYSRTYGTVGGIAILLLIFYIDAVVLLVGAEINSELDFARTGIASGPTPEASAVATEQADEEDRELAEELKARRE
jgi:membrane protein